jgi:membrane protein implicated in regulation of membrane protease activity
MTLLLLLFGVLLIVALCVVLIALGAVALHARRKKRAPSALTLMGRTASVVSPLRPEGAVLVADELWRARAVAGGQIDGGRVRVVGARGHLLEVEAEGGRAVRPAATH